MYKNFFQIYHTIRQKRRFLVRQRLEGPQSGSGGMEQPGCGTLQSAVLKEAEAD
jgi:hypothetical protein